MFSETDFHEWKNELTLTEIQKILQLEYNRKYSVKRYFATDKGKQKRKELNRKYYLQRKAMKELVE